MQQDNKTIPGHTFLAKLGKKRLRPGGKKVTKFLFEHASLQNKKVLEVGCNNATTACEIASKYNCLVNALDIDPQAVTKAKENVIRHKLNHKVSVQEGNATQLPFDDNSFDIVINEAMLTMLPNKTKQKCLNEYYRVLKPGGLLLTHDVMIVNNEYVIKELCEAINIKVQPLTYGKWLELFESNGFKIQYSSNGRMTLMNPIGMIRDEGLFNTFRILMNSRKPENKQMFQQMFVFFKKYKDDLNYIALVSKKSDK